MRRTLGWIGLWLILLAAAPSRAGDVVHDYVDHYRESFPSRATALGDYRFDDQLERLDAPHRERWIAFNEAALKNLQTALSASPDHASRIDLELLQRQVEQEILEWKHNQQAERDPLFWVSPLSQSSLYLLLRRDRPASERLAFAVKRTAQIPRLIDEALAALRTDQAEVIDPIRAGEAASRLRALVVFYRDGLHQAEGADAAMKRQLQRAGRNAARAIEKLALRAEKMAAIGKADFRLGADYAERFRIVTGLKQPVAEVRTQAYRELASKREEAAAYARGVWASLRPNVTMPLGDAEVLRALFAVVEARRPASTAELVAQFTADADAAFAFVREHEVMTLPEPRSLVIGTAPAWLGGQSVGGVYSAGPYQPDAETLFLLPNISDDAPSAAKQMFFSAFNTGFNRMITAHELVPGHYVQLKVASRQKHVVRSLFGDGVYTEGWGSFSERLLLDLGWGGPHERLAHYKKQLENIARLIADIEVHTGGWDEARLARFLTDDALLDAQFASNLWRRAMLTSPQLTTYHLGYRDIHALWLDWRLQNAKRPLREFVDGMLTLGAVPVREYREALMAE